MRSERILLALFTCMITGLGFAQPKAHLEKSNPTDEIKDGALKVIIDGGEGPFKYLWSNNSTSVYDYEATGLAEGQEYSVQVVDVNGDTLKLSGEIEAESIAEKINAGMTPAVGAVGSVFFWDPFDQFGLYDPIIYVDKADVTAPFAKNDSCKLMRIEELLVEDGATVEDGQAIASVSSNMGELHIYSVGKGKITWNTKVGDTLKYLDGDEAKIAGVNIATISYDQPQPLKNPNGSDSALSGIPLVVIWLIAGAIFFTIFMKFINIRGFKHAIQLVQGKYDDPDDQGEVSHFQALTTALSGTVGLGNIGGVAIAVATGGAGATFWMILAGLLGMTSKFVECTLGVKYREMNPETGEVYGGPFYYLSKGLAKRNMKTLGKILAGMFAILCIGGSFGGGNMFQANQAFAQFSTAIGGWEGGGPIFGVILAALVFIVIIGGVKKIASVTDKIVPLMVGIYVLFALIIIFMNIDQLGMAFNAIFSGAFSPDAMKGGILGVLIIGFQRAAFSNEAGVGSASIAHSAAKTKEPVSEGIVALLEPLIDTVVVCTMTALVLIFTGFDQNTGGLQGADLTSAAFSAEFGWFQYVLTIAIILFAFSTLISWSYYGLKAWTYLFGKSKTMDITYKSLFLIFIVIGSSIGLGAVIDFSDMMVLGMAFPNILGLVIMSKEVRHDMNDYFARIKSGAIKRFK